MTADKVGSHPERERQPGRSGPWIVIPSPKGERVARPGNPYPSRCRRAVCESKRFSAVAARRPIRLRSAWLSPDLGDLGPPIPRFGKGRPSPTVADDALLLGVLPVVAVPAGARRLGGNRTSAHVGHQRAYGSRFGMGSKVSVKELLRYTLTVFTPPLATVPGGSYDPPGATFILPNSGG